MYGQMYHDAKTICLCYACHIKYNISVKPIKLYNDGVILQSYYNY